MTLRSQVFPTLGALTALTLLSCTGEPARSQCEAMCDWAVSCHSAERELDVEAATTACLESARAKDASCANVEAGEANPATVSLVEPCVTTVDAAASAGECSGFTGTIDEIKTATPPAECVAASPDAAGAFDEVRDTTKESGADLCQRTTDTFCDQIVSCALGDVADDIPSELTAALGFTPFELCQDKLDLAFTSTCVANDLYGAEETLDDVNPTRQSARECLRDFGALTCPQLTSGNPDDLPEFCAGAFTSAEDALAVATALVEASDEIIAAYESVQ